MESTSMEKKPRARKSNFSPEEIAILVDEGVEHNAVLSSAFGPGITKKSKDSIWEKIASKISANTAGVRSATDVRKKWNDLRCQVKKKAQVMKKESGKTGGGPTVAVLMNELDEKVLSTIPTCQVEGIDGGIETPICTEDQPPTSNQVLKNGDDLDEASLPLESAAAQRTQMQVVPTTSISLSASKGLVIPPPTKLVKSTVTAASNQIGSMVKVEESKLEVLNKLLSVERERIAVERERLEVERGRLALEKKRLELKEKTLNSSVEQFLTPLISFE